MRQSNLFGKIQKIPPKDETSISAKLLIQAGFINKEISGVYSFLPLGLRVLEKIKTIITKEMNNIGGQKLQLTTLQKKEVWEKTDRWRDEIFDNWFKTKLKNGTIIGLAPTHEEPIANLASQYINSYKDLPLYLYEIRTVFRNELRAKSGIMRGREFNWKALYSFSASEEEHNKFYQKCEKSYLKIFEKVGLRELTYKTFSSGGSFSKYSHEFQTISSAGEDIIYIDKKSKIAINKEVYNPKTLKDLGIKKENLTKKKAVEVGNIFSLGYKFSDPLNIKFKDKNGNKKIPFMGCYGMGISRLMGVIAEIFNDKKGLTWPFSVSPFDIHLIFFGKEKTKEKAEKIYQELKSNKIDVLLDDRDISPGNKFNDSDLIGIPYKLIVSDKNLEKGFLELETRSTGEKIEINLKQVKEFINSEKNI